MAGFETGGGQVAQEFRDLNHNATMEPYEDPSLPVAERVEDLLGRMTLEEKAGQLFHNVVLPGPGGSVTEGPSGARRQPPATEFISNRLMTHFNLA
ncbi:MAG: glycoside hydrolase family 3 protein, partial [Acidimicrobiales bacterium]